MAIKFFLVWVVVTSGVFCFTYFVSKSSKVTALGWASKVGISFVVAAILLAIMMVVNNFSGV